MTSDRTASWPSIPQIAKNIGKGLFVAFATQAAHAAGRPGIGYGSGDTFAPVLAPEFDQPVPLPTLPAAKLAPKAQPPVSVRVAGHGPPAINGTDEVLALGEAPVPAVAGRPRLQLDGPRLEKSCEITYDEFFGRDCAIAERSLGNEIQPLPGDLTGGVTRKLLRFDVAIQNVGDGDFVMGKPSTGRPDLYEWGECHQHWHVKNFTAYTLLDEKRNRVIAGRKQAFCLMDLERYDKNAGSAKYGCSNQGISPGYADVYFNGLDGQWLDVTGVQPGNYTLRVEIDPINRFPEAHDGPLVANAKVKISEDAYPTGR